MELKVTIDLSDRALAALTSIADAICARAKNAGIVPSEGEREAATGNENTEKPVKKPAAKKASPKTQDSDKISTNSVEPKAAEPAGEASAADEVKKEAEKQELEIPAQNADMKAPQEAAENDDELGKGESGPVIAELTAKMIARINDECRDRATMNRNLRATCEKLGLQFPTVPALIQAVGYGNAYKACVGA